MPQNLYNNVCNQLHRKAESSPLLQQHSSMFGQCCCNNNYGDGNTSEHAEIRAVLNFIKYLLRKGYSYNKIRLKINKELLIVIRLNNNSSKPNMFRNSMPCATCIPRLKLWGIKKAYVLYRRRHFRNKKNKSTWRG